MPRFLLIETPLPHSLVRGKTTLQLKDISQRLSLLMPHFDYLK